MSHSGRQDPARSKRDGAPVLGDSNPWKDEPHRVKGSHGREGVISDRWSEKVSEEETFEQRPAWNEDKSP